MFTHCYGHVLNLAVKDVCNVLKCLKDTFDTSREIFKLVTKSLQRDTHLKQIQIERGNEDSNIQSFCPTRWTMRGQTLESILGNYKELMTLWKWSLSVVSETEMKAHIRVVQSFIGKFGFLFGCHLGNFCCLKQTIFKKNSKTCDVCRRSTIIGQKRLKCSSQINLMKAFCSFGKEFSSPKFILMSMTSKFQERAKCHQDSKVANVNRYIIMQIQKIYTSTFTTKLLTE